MEHDEQMPDFLFTDTIGLISNGKSQIKCYNESFIVSANNTLVVYDTKSLELKDRITERSKHIISEFGRFESKISENYVIGYENGTIKLFKDNESVQQYKAHYKKINHLKIIENYIISSSNDGNIILYDIFTEEIKVWYKGLVGGVVQIIVSGEKLFVLSTDSCIRVYNLLDVNIKEIHTFESSVTSFAVINDQMIIFYTDDTSKIYNYLTKEYKNFDSFKYVVKTVIKYNSLAVLTKDKMHVYKTLDGGLTFKKITTFKLSQKYSDFDFASENEIILIAKNNTVKKLNIQNNNKNTISNHQNEIFDTILNDSDIITCSSERFIVWGVKEDALKKYHTCLFDFHAHSISKFEKNILVSSNEKIYAFNYKSNNIIFEFQINNKMIKYIRDKLYVVYEDNLKIYSATQLNNQINLSIARDEKYDSHIVFLNTSYDAKYYGMSMLNNHINIYDSSSHDLKLTLYGHSLPVRYFEFSDDCKSLLSCGTDKVVKLWGFDFGECRKTFLVDSKKTSYVNNTSFLCADNGINYFKKHELIKKYKVSDVERTFYDGKKLFATSRYGIYFYKIGEYEFLEREESSELEEELLKETKIINYRCYDQFLKELNMLEDDRDASMDGLYEVLRVIDLAEFGKFAYFLNQQQVRILVTCLEKYYDMFPIVAIRFCRDLIRTHSYMCEDNKEVYHIYNDMKSRSREMMDNAGCNLLEFAMFFDF